MKLREAQSSATWTQMNSNTIVWRHFWTKLHCPTQQEQFSCGPLYIYIIPAQSTNRNIQVQKFLSLCPNMLTQHGGKILEHFLNLAVYSGCANWKWSLDDQIHLTCNTFARFKEQFLYIPLWVPMWKMATFLVKYSAILKLPTRERDMGTVRLAR